MAAGAYCGIRPIGTNALNLAQIKRPYHKGEKLWVEIYAPRELQYFKLMLRVGITGRPFFAPARRRATRSFLRQDMTLRHHRESPLLDLCSEGLPARANYDADWFAAEQKAVWAHNWVYAVRLSDFAPGTMRRLTVAGVNVILCRNPDGVITAFHNLCRRRGARVVDGASGTCKSAIVCPFHGWDYNLDGTHRGALQSESFGQMNRTKFGLKPIEMQVWHGFIFLRFAP